MGKPKERPRHPKARRLANGLLPMTEGVEEMLRKRTRREEPFAPRTEAQARYAEAITKQTLTFGVGPAGTGKTFVAAALAAEALVSNDVERVVITRPICEAGEKIGFLPGDMKEKTDPYMKPLVEALERRMGASYVEALMKSGKIEVAPLAFIRGRSLERCLCILDEAQNTTPAQMKLFLTRMGEGTRVIVDGDLTQIDIPGLSGLADALDRLTGKPGVAGVRFSRADIVRSGFVQMVVDAYRRPETDEAHEDEMAGLQRVLGT